MIVSLLLQISGLQWCVLVTLGALLWWYYSHHLFAKLPSGEWGYPVVGTTVQFLTSPPKWSNYFQEKYGRIFYTSALLNARVVLTTAEMSKWWNALDKKGYTVLGWPTIFIKLLEGTVSMVDGEKHTHYRKQFLSYLSHEAMRLRYDVTKEVTEKYFAENVGEELKGYASIKRWAFILACRILMGDLIPEGKYDKLVTVYEDYLKGFASVLPIELLDSNFGTAMKAKREIESVFETVVRQARKDPSLANNTLLEKMLDLRDENGNLESDAMLAAHLNSMLWAGHDTTCATVMSAIYHLEKNPEKLRLLKEEIKKCEEISYSELLKLPIVHGVVWETLRIDPPVAAVVRKLSKSVNYLDYLFPKGYSMHLDIYSITSDPQTWEDPQEFIPERHATPPKSGTLPVFGGGTRACLGKTMTMLEIKMYLTCRKIIM